jgi:hypothetical protein
MILHVVMLLVVVSVVCNFGIAAVIVHEFQNYFN